MYDNIAIKKYVCFFSTQVTLKQNTAKLHIQRTLIQKNYKSLIIENMIYWLEVLTDKIQIMHFVVTRVSPFLNLS